MIIERSYYEFRAGPWFDLIKAYFDPKKNDESTEAKASADSQ